MELNEWLESVTCPPVAHVGKSVRCESLSLSKHQKDRKDKIRKRQGHPRHFSPQPFPYRTSSKKNRKEREREREFTNCDFAKTLISKRSVMASSKERETFVYIAKLAEQAERYEGFRASSFSSPTFPSMCLNFVDTCLLVIAYFELVLSKYMFFSSILYQFQCKKLNFLCKIWLSRLTVYCLLSVWLRGY